MEPVLYALPVFSPQLYVRNDGSMNSVDDLWDRRVAIPAPNDYAAILGRAALLDEGLDVESDCEMIYVHDVFSQDAVRESLELLRQGEVDGVLTHNFAIDLVRETVPEIDEQVRGLGEGPSMSYGVLALLYDLPESEAIALIDAALELSPDLLEALTPFTGMIDSAEPLAYPFVDSVEALGIDPWPAAVGASFDGQRGEEPKPPRATDLRVAVIPAAGAVAERNRFSTPVLKSLQRASAELDYELAVGETPDGGNMADTVQAMIDGGHTVIVAVGWPDIEPLWGLAQDHPEITFINFWGHYPQELPNLQSFAYRMEEAGLLAGALAGWATEHGHVAVVGGARVDAVERLVAGFERGLAVSCDGCTFDAPLAGTFDDEALGAEMGRNAVAKGADVVFNAAGGLGSAAIRAAAQEGAWVIGVDWDEYVTTFEQGQVPGAERLLGSVVLRVDRQAVQALTALARGEFTPGNVVSGVRDGGIEFVPGRDVAHPRQAELDAQLKELETMIRAGEVPGR
jgi:basic membrane lipoprotein Med (substrate-binding protein (PBP1-ABC) superfamily)